MLQVRKRNVNEILIYDMMISFFFHLKVSENLHNLSLKNFVLATFFFYFFAHSGHAENILVIINTT